MSFVEDIALLNAITGFAGEIATKPRAIVPAEWWTRCDTLDAQFAAAHSAYPDLIRNFAPLLLTSIRRALMARFHGEESRVVEKWDCLVGHLMPLVRGDAAAILARAKE
ncbi:MAG: hypothetical protein WBR29_07380 [Gammaproteobacteria bacterium]